MTPIEITERSSTNYSKKCINTIFIFEMDTYIFAITTNAWGITLELGKGSKNSFEVLEQYYIEYRKNQAKTNDLISSILTLVRSGEAAKDSLIDLTLSLSFIKLNVNRVFASITKSFF